MTDNQELQIALKNLTNAVEHSRKSTLNLGRAKAKLARKYREFIMCLNRLDTAMNKVQECDNEKSASELWYSINQVVNVLWAEEMNRFEPKTTELREGLIKLFDSLSWPKHIDDEAIMSFSMDAASAMDVLDQVHTTEQIETLDHLLKLFSVYLYNPAHGLQFLTASVNTGVYIPLPFKGYSVCYSFTAIAMPYFS